VVERAALALGPVAGEALAHRDGRLALGPIAHRLALGPLAVADVADGLPIGRAASCDPGP
jgi:hypothetical protein